jgi:serine/threonine protein kinase
VHELIHRIGGGACGEVWLAGNVLGELRAVKIIHRSRFTDPRPFEREFEGIQRFEPISRSHPSQLAILHVGKNEPAGCFYYVMELEDDATAECGTRNAESIDGSSSSIPHSAFRTPQSYAPRTLRQELKDGGRLAAARVIEVGLALAEALAHLHSHGLVHRDITPSNIVFVGGRPKPADIGLVTDAGDQCSMVGTEGYLPPEGPGTPVADVFALGKVLYEALTGLDRRKFPELPGDLRQWSDAALALELNAILVKACAADARQRYPSAEALLADLRHLAEGRSVKRRRAWQQTQRQ